MAFVYSNFQKWSQGDAVGGNNMWAYVSSTDAVATIVTNGYFNDVNNITADGVSVSDLIQVFDLIWVVCTDYEGYVLVSDVEPTIVSAQFQITVGAGAVGTANLADSAVTTQKIADDAVTSAKLDPNTIQYLKVPMTAAQFNGMYAAPFEILPAPGANRLLVVKQAMLEVDYGGAQFANGGVFGLQYDTDVHGAGVGASETAAAAVAIAWAADSTLALAGACPSSAAADTVNKSVCMSNLTGAFDTGSSTVDVHIWYEIVVTTL